MSVATINVPIISNNTLDETNNKRDKAFQTIRDAYLDYSRSLVYAAPEIRELKFLRRNPVVLMYDMAKKVPSGEENDNFVLGFSELAFIASLVPLYNMYVDWWVPVGEQLLGNVIGECDNDWKKEAIGIWMDANYTKSFLDDNDI